MKITKIVASTISCLFLVRTRANIDCYGGLTIIPESMFNGGTGFTYRDSIQHIGSSDLPKLE